MMKFGRPIFQVAFQIAPQGSYLCWRSGEIRQDQELHFGDAAPSSAFEQAISVLVERLGQTREELLTHTHWRLVLPDGYTCIAPRPVGVWRASYVAALASDLEAVIPVPVEQLTLMALPLSAEKVWMTAQSTKLLELWTQTARALGLSLEGIWSPASVLVETLLERRAALPGPLLWCNGHCRLEIETKPAEISPARPNARDPGHVVDTIRVRPGESPQYNLPWKALVESDDTPSSGPEEPPPIAFWPAGLVGRLQRIDPSESLNALRGNFQTARLFQRRQRLLLRGLVLGGCAFLLWALAGHLNSLAQERSIRASQQQLTSIWHQVQSQLPPPSMPAGRLEEEVAQWSALQGKTPLRPPAQGALARLAALVGALPPNNAITLQSFRMRGGESWIEGLMKTPAEAHLLEESVAKSRQWQEIEPMRLSNAGASFVRFSLHLRFQEGNGP